MGKKAVVIMLCVAACLALPAAGFSAEEGVYEFKPFATISDVLHDNIGKRVILRLDGGDTLEGTVTKVGDSLVHIARLTGRDFYDALVPIDSISAVIYKARSK
jgi:hypothetical protein